MPLQSESSGLASTNSRRFLRDVGTVLVGAAGAQAIGFAIAPALTRTFSPSHFGAFAVYLAITSLLVPVASGRYAMAIMLPDSEGTARQLTRVSIAIAAAFSLALLLVVWLLHRPIATTLRLDDAAWLRLLPISILAGSLHQTFTFYANRRQQFRIVASARFIHVLVMIGVQLAFGLLRPSASGLILGDMAGLLAATAVLARVYVRREVRSESSPAKHGYRDTLHAYREFPLIMIWGGLIDGLALSTVPILLSRHFGPTVAGQYALVYRMAYGPMAVVGNSVSTVLFQRMASAWNANKQFPPILIAVSRRLTIFSSVVAALCVAVGPQIFAVAFGPNWRPAGEFARLLAPMFAVAVLSSTLSPVLIVRQQQGRLFALQTFWLAATLASILTGALSGLGASTTLAGYALASGAAHGLFLLVIHRSTRPAATKTPKVS